MIHILYSIYIYMCKYLSIYVWSESLNNVVRPPHCEGDAPFSFGFAVPIGWAFSITSHRLGIFHFILAPIGWGFSKLARHKLQVNASQAPS